RLHARQPPPGLGLVAWQLDEDERDAVAQLAGTVIVADADRHHRLERRRRLPATLQEAADASRRGGEHDVVDAGPVALLDRTEVPKRSVRGRKPPAGRDGRVEEAGRRGKKRVPRRTQGPYAGAKEAHRAARAPGELERHQREA